MKNKKINDVYFNEAVDAIEESDIRKAVENADKINEKAERSSKLKRYLKDLSMLSSLLKDYWKGNYRSIPYKAIAVVAFTILYVLNIADVIPDFVPGLGLLDDASVIAFCLKIVNTELNKYRDWKENSPISGLE